MLDKLIPIVPTAPNVKIQELIELFGKNQFKLVLSKAEPLILLFPTDVILLNIKGVALTNLGKLEHSKAIYEKIIRMKPDYVEAHNNLGNTLKAMGQLENALKSYLKASKLDPDYAAPHYNIANTFQEIGDINRSIDAFRAAINLQPNYPGAYCNLGIALQDQQKLKEAIECYKIAIKQKPDYAEAYNNIGTILTVQGKLKEAIATYNKALSLKPDYAEAYNNMGNVLKDQGELKEAIAAYNKALSLKPDYAEAYNNMGNVLQKQGKVHEAIGAYNRALAIKPDYPEASHIVSSLTGKTTKSAPREYVENLFDGYATKFDQLLAGKLEYNIPKVLTQLAVKKHGNGSLGSIIDLGCGTGLTGLKIREFCSYLEGIDLSNKMLELAKTKNVYDKLSHVDIVEYLSNAELDFDYFISTDVFIYLGELSEVFRLIKSQNKKSGKLIFSTEHTEKEGFHLEKSGRYSHSMSYIEGLCRKFKFSISHFSVANLRKENGVFLIGGLYLLDF